MQLDDVVRQHSDKARAELLEMSPDAAADERVLVNMAANAFSTIITLTEVEEQLVGRMQHVVDSPHLMRALAGALRDVVASQNAISRRVRDSLSAAASLRVQRRFLEPRGGRNGV
jgi:hypothetical protein